MQVAPLYVVLLSAALLTAQSTAKRKSGLPDPPKSDVPYIIHADLLVETEVGEAKEETRRDEQFYVIAGAASPVKTPLAGPEFLFQSQEIAPDKLRLYKLDVRGGRRELLAMRRKKPVAKDIRVSVFRVRENLFRIRVYDSLAPGEYSLSPDGSNAIFCFAVE